MRAGFAFALAAIGFCTVSGIPAVGQQAPEAAPAGDRPGFGPMIAGDQPARPKDAGIMATAIADLNGDGMDELIVALGHYPPQTNRKEGLLVLSPDAGSAMRERTTDFLAAPPSFVHPRSIQVKDLNRDGREDVFIAAHGYDKDPFPGERNALLLSTAGKHVNARGVPKYSDFSHGAALGDVNGDRFGDVYVSNGHGKSPKSRPYMLLGRAGNKVAVSRQLSADVLGPDTYYSSAALADLDGDGRDDLILGSNGTGAKDELQRNVVYLNQGRRKIFRSSAPDIVLPWGRYGGGTNTVDIRPVDINRDGLTDILMAQHDNVPTFHGYGIQLLINRGNGRFRDETKTRLGGTIRDPKGQFLNHLMPADFFGDGHPDLVTYGSAGDRVAPLVYVNDGTGHFARYDRSLFMAPSDEGYYHGQALPADVDGDGLSDIVNVSFGPGDAFEVQTFLNTGPVGPQVAPAIVQQPRRVKAKRKAAIRLSVAARGSRPLSYQWTRDGSPVPSDGSVLTIRRAGKADAGLYKVTVTNAAGAVTSRQVRVVVR